MIRSFVRPLAVALVLASAAAPVLASDEVSEADKAQITTMLTEMGYEVRKIEIDDGELEAYVVKDGKAYELVLERTFEIVESKEG
jgi:hypothetical protein